MGTENVRKRKWLWGQLPPDKSGGLSLPNPGKGGRQPVFG